MSFWRKAEKASHREESFGGVAAAALAGASPDQLCGEVYSLLAAELRDASVERFGVWICSEREEAEPNSQAFLSGRFWNVGREDASAECEALDSNFPVPWKRLDAGVPVLEELPPASAVALGPAAEMRRLLWVPVRVEGRLNGLLLAATRKTRGPLPEAAMVRTAAELALAIEFRQATVSAATAAQDAAFFKKVCADALSHTSLDVLLQQIVNRAAGRGPAGQPPASFVTIGILPSKALSGAPRDASMEFRWSSGDPLWARSPSGEPVASIWHEALEKRRTTGQEIRAPWSPNKLVRVVAIPLVTTDEPAGAMVAWLPTVSATLATVERLELHSRLASIAIALFARNKSGRGAAESARFFLEHASEPAFLLNDRLEITGASNSGRKMLTLGKRTLGEKGIGQPQSVSYGTSAQLFRPGEWNRLVVWMNDISRHSEAAVPHKVETELRTGRHVRLLAASLPDGSLSLLVQRPGEQDEGTPKRVGNETQSLIEWLDQGIVIFDEHDAVRAVNLRFSQLFGLSAAELESAPTLRELIGLVAPRVADSSHFAESWCSATREASEHEEIQVLRPVPRLLERISRPVLDLGGVRTGRVEIYRDLTAQQLFQSKLRKNQRLVSLGERVGGIVHELNNPLTTILGYAQRLLARPGSAFSRADVQRILSEAERASAIVRQLLGSTRESSPEFHAVNLNSLVLRTVDLQRFQLTSEKIRVELELAKDLPAILGDTGQLQQVLMNLISNSRHALTAQRRTGTISVRTRVSDSGRVQLEVADDGPGIPEAVRHRVFDPFFTTKPAGLGTGLGLSIVAGLVRQHNGHIRLVNSKVPGATFVMDFPAAPVEKPLLLQELPAALSSTLPVAHGERVLVVEDEPTVAQLIADLLSDLGYSAEIQHDARRALVAALNREYVLVVCDMKMPGLDGPHFYKSLAEAGSPLISRFLFVTGDVLGAATQEFLKQNRLPHIPKPFRVEEFAEKIAQVSGMAGTKTAVQQDVAHKTVTSHG